VFFFCAWRSPAGKMPRYKRLEYLQMAEKVTSSQPGAEERFFPRKARKEEEVFASLRMTCLFLFGDKTHWVDASCRTRSQNDTVRSSRLEAGATKTLRSEMTGQLYMLS
jgi:hypothetical protein